jgi:heme-degrading monooxygenase HmoA
MFARNVALRLKPNTLAEFTQTLDNEVIPMLRKQKGFQDEITFCNLGGMDVIAISLWDTQEHAEAYNTAAYPDVLKSLNKVLDGSPRVRVSDVISSTLQKTAIAVAA